MYSCDNCGNPFKSHGSKYCSEACDPATKDVSYSAPIRDTPHNNEVSILNIKVTRWYVWCKRLSVVMIVVGAILLLIGLLNALDRATIVAWSLIYFGMLHVFFGVISYKFYKDFIWLLRLHANNDG